MKKVVAIIQARMSSTRLPGKVLLDLGGKTVLARMIERVRMAKGVDQVVVATTIDPSDDPIVTLCAREKVEVFRGSLPDVLDRYYQTAISYKADRIVRLTGDCPLIDPGLIDKAIEALITKKADFACNRLPPPFHRTYPIGLDVEVCTFSALKRAWHEAVEKHDREHVLPYLYEAEGRFKVVQLDHTEDLGNLRWTLDTPEDLLLLKEIISRLGNRNDFSWLQVLEIIKQDPTLSLLNASVRHKSMFDVA
ncbi:MAG: glycosyltransferase family protein [Chloroflexi bacterium]|nr:glycosyltransferase family protein [Chloroflexota bacterium]